MDFVISINLPTCTNYCFHSSGLREGSWYNLTNWNGSFVLKNWRVFNSTFFRIMELPNHSKILGEPTWESLVMIIELNSLELLAVAHMLYIKSDHSSEFNERLSIASMVRISCFAKYNKMTLIPWENEDLSKLRKMTRVVVDIRSKCKGQQPVRLFENIQEHL